MTKRAHRERSSRAPDAIQPSARRHPSVSALSHLPPISSTSPAQGSNPPQAAIDTTVGDAARPILEPEARAALRDARVIEPNVGLPGAVLDGQDAVVGAARVAPAHHAVERVAACLRAGAVAWDAVPPLHVAGDPRDNDVEGSGRSGVDDVAGCQARSPRLDLTAATSAHSRCRRPRAPRSAHAPKTPRQ